jgi:hypothetical protein
MNKGESMSIGEKFAAAAIGAIKNGAKNIKPTGKNNKKKSK